MENAEKSGQSYRPVARTVCFGFLMPADTKPEDDTIYIQKRQRNGQYSGEAMSNADFRIKVTHGHLSAEYNDKRADSKELKLSYEDFVRMILEQNKPNRLERKFHSDAEVEDIAFREFLRSSNP